MTENLTSLETDSRSRERIVTDTSSNFFVEAGAGSGKTSMLINRMVAMVEQGIDIRKICAITFTKAAAGEFYERFQALLMKRSHPEYLGEERAYPGALPTPTDETRKRCAEALQNIDLCFMGTIDAFCNLLLREHPFEAGIPSDATLISKEEAAALYRQEFVRICEGTYGQPLADLAKQFRLVHWNAEEVFVTGMEFWMNHRNASMQFSAKESYDIDSEFFGTKQELKQVMGQLEQNSHWILLDEKNARNAWERFADSKRIVGKSWASQFQRLKTTLKNLSGLRVLPEAVLQGFDYGSLMGENTGRKKFLKFQFEEDGVLEQLDQIQYDISMTFLQQCCGVMESVLQAQGKLTYFDYLYDLRNMLRKDAEQEGKLIGYIAERHSYYLIDEFQDTNPLQAEVFFYLTAKKPVPNWKQCEPKPGTLFIVGDPKQSIYRFRDADVTSFLRVKNIFRAQAGDVLYLTRNFRSTRSMCTYFNHVFGQLLSEETDVQSKFESIPLPSPADTAEFEGQFFYRSYQGKGISGEQRNETDEKQMARIIRRLVGNPQYSLRDRGADALRPIAYRDFMIITQNKGQLANIIQVFTEENIPVKVEGNVPFASCEGLKGILDLYRAVVYPNDQQALYRALTGSLLGFSKETLVRCRQENMVLSLTEPLPDATVYSAPVKAVAESLCTLAQIRKKAMQLSPAALYEEILEQYPVLVTVGADYLEIVYYVLELLRKAVEDGTVHSAEDGLAFLEDLMNGKTEVERCLRLQEQTNAVHVANLHKVKGLEAPIVILAQGSDYKPSPSTHIVHEDAETKGYVFQMEYNLPTGGKSSYFATKAYDVQKETESSCLQAEGDRLLYVAATRARNALIICRSIAINAKGSVSEIKKWEPLITADVKDFFETIADNPTCTERTVIVADADALYAEGKSQHVLQQRGGEQPTYRVMTPSHAKSASKTAEEESVDQSVVVATDSHPIGAHQFPALLGTMTHRLMEVIVSSKNRFQAEDLITDILKDYLTPTTEPYVSDFHGALQTVLQRMQAGGYVQENDVPQDILTTLLSADEVYCEVPFCYKNPQSETDELWNGIMDVMYRVGDTWHIVDYKTNLDGSDLDEKYKVQMEAYEKAFYEMTGMSAKAKTYHIVI